MTPDRISRAAGLFATARRQRTPIDVLPQDCRPVSLEEGYAVQEALHNLLGASAGGYKIGCTTAVMQKFLGIAQPCGGTILQADTHPSPAHLRHGDFVRPGVECEIAVRLGRDLRPDGAPYDRAAVTAAAAACMPAIEIVDDRYVDYRALDAATLIADDFFGAGCVLGRSCTAWDDLAGLQARMAINGVEVGNGSGAQVMGHPFEALAWLANTMAQRGHALEQGQIVLTGSIVETCWIAPGDRVSVTVEGLGSAEAVFA